MTSEPVDVEQSCTVRVPATTAFDYTLPVPLPEIFRHRFGIIPPIKEIRDQTGTWGQVGQTRTVVPAGGGSMREELTAVNRPDSFRYHLTDVRGPMSALVAEVHGEWAFSGAEDRTEITWRWRITPRPAASSVLMPVLTWFWHGYARKALDGLAAKLDALPT